MTCDQDQRDIVQGCVDVRMLLMDGVESKLPHPSSLHSAIGVGAVVMEIGD